MKENAVNRQIVLDTETTGINPRDGHRIIEIGCVELINRRFTGNNFHVYINPQREIEQEAIDVHGITNEFLADKPVFSRIADSFFDYIQGAELVIHNAPFDVGFMDHEFALLRPAKAKTSTICGVLDTLALAKKLHPGQKNNLDALCRRYGIDNSHRTLHGALLDAEILADVYLLMTGGQVALNLTDEQAAGEAQGNSRRPINIDRQKLKVIKATADELVNHQARLDIIEQKGAPAIWRK